MSRGGAGSPFPPGPCEPPLRVAGRCGPPGREASVLEVLLDLFVDLGLDE